MIELLDAWQLHFCYAEKTRLQASVLLKALDHYLQEFDLKLTKSVPDDVLVRFFLSRKINRQSMIRYAGLIDNVLGFASEHGFIDWTYRPVTPQLKSQRGRAPVRVPVFLSHAERDAVMVWLKEPGANFSEVRYQVAFTLCLLCGLRNEEACRITYGSLYDRNTDTAFLRVIGKNNKERIVPAPTMLLRYLEMLDAFRKNSRKHCETTDSTYLCGSIENRPYSATGLYKMVQRILTQLGIRQRKLSPHVLRHTFCTYLIENNVPIHQVRLLMGHQNLGTTSKYVHTQIGKANLENLSALFE